MTLMIPAELEVGEAKLEFAAATKNLALYVGSTKNAAALYRYQTAERRLRLAEQITQRYCQRKRPPTTVSGPPVKICSR
jgi:hypothetical protein